MERQLFAPKWGVGRQEHACGCALDARPLLTETAEDAQALARPGERRVDSEIVVHILCDDHVILRPSARAG